MARPKPTDPYDAVRALPVHFKVGTHELSISYVAEGRWTVTLDGGPVSRNYATQVEAWEAGVRLADEKDRAPAP